ncbi:MAG TPA: hypothetical protein VF075_08550, partial [Pyrinomonadaceae bacterium]
MRAIRKTIYTTFILALVTAATATSGMAQVFTNESAARETVRRIQTRTDSLQRAIQYASDRNNYPVDDINRLVLDFESAVNQLDRRLSYRRAASADVQGVLDRAARIDNFFSNNRLGSGSQRDWQMIRSDLDQLANYYNLSTSWGTSSGSYPANPGSYQGNNDYNLNDYQMRQLVDRLNTSSATFSRYLRQDINRNSNGRYSADEVRRQLSDFEMALVQLRNRVNSRQVGSADARNVLDRAAYLNNFITNRQFSYQTQNSWNSLRPDLERLASAFNIA